MTEELKQLIEEEAERYVLSEMYNVTEHNKDTIVEDTIQECNNDVKQGFKAGANFILSKWQEAERWRKVEEELPDIDDYLQHSVVAYLVKLDSGAYALAVYHADGIWLESGTEHDLNVTEWKPIS